MNTGSRLNIIFLSVRGVSWEGWVWTWGRLGKSCHSSLWPSQLHREKTHSEDYGNGHRFCPLEQQFRSVHQLKLPAKVPLGSNTRLNGSGWGAACSLLALAPTKACSRWPARQQGSGNIFHGCSYFLPGTLGRETWQKRYIIWWWKQDSNVNSFLDGRVAWVQLKGNPRGCATRGMQLWRLD